MSLLLEPSAEIQLQLIAEHRPDSFRRWMQIVPSDWWVTAARCGREYGRIFEDAREFTTYYNDVAKTMDFSHDWFSEKLPMWHNLLSDRRELTTDVLEVGVFEGRSVIFVLEYLRRAKVTAVDHFVIKKGWTSSQNITLTRDSEEAFDHNTSRYEGRVRKIGKSSWAALSDLIYEESKFDIIYIDSAHTSPDVLADSLLAWRLLRPGGIFIWDDFMLDVWDIGPNTTTEGISEFLRMYDGTFEWLYAGWQVAVKKIKDLTPSYIGI